MKKRISAMLLITAMLLCMMAFADQGSVYAESQIPVVEKASLELNKPTEICVNANEDSGPYYAAYSFKTSNMKSYYGVTVEKAEGVNWDPSWYLVTDTKDREGTKVVWGRRAAH